MLGQNGEARRRVLSPSEAQQGESHCYAAMHNANQNYDLIKFFKEQEEEEGGARRGSWRSSWPTTNAWWQKRDFRQAG